jgi:hypothetical protein
MMDEEGTTTSAAAAAAAVLTSDYGLGRREQEFSVWAARDFIDIFRPIILNGRQ